MDNSQPKNMQELLRFAIRQQQHEGNECVQIDKDKKTFLDNVLQSMTVNVIEEFLKAIRILQHENSSEEEMVDALELIRDYIDHIDFANSFVKIEGADILINCIKKGYKKVRITAIRIVAEMSQNNLFCQQHFLKCGIVEELIKYLTNEDVELVASALYALSAIVRNYEPALIEFMERDGLNYVNNCLSIESSRVFLKACFLITSISSEFSLVNDQCAKIGIFSTLFKKLRIVNGYDANLEMILQTMSVLLESRYCNPSDDENKYIVDILRSIIIKNKYLPECEEIVSYSDSLLQKLESK